MRVRRQLKTLITLTTLASLGSLTACAPYGRQSQSGAEISVRWDSGPIDRDYARMHDEMIARHNREIASPRSDESSNQRDSRQSAERRDLDARYSRGKSAHSDRVPPSEQ
jgi:hypothetical protein